VKGIDSCIWDKTQGLVVVLSAQPVQLTNPLYLLVHSDEPKAIRYYGGMILPEQNIQVLNVAGLTRFEVLFFEDAQAMDNLDAAHDRLLFDHKIAYSDTDDTLQVHLRVFALVSDVHRTEVVVSDAPYHCFNENPGDFFKKRKHTNQKHNPNPLSWVATPFNLQRVQGPSVNPDQDSDEGIPVNFCCDRIKNDVAGVLPAFEYIVTPGVVIELQAYAAAAQDIISGFVFFHQAYGAPDSQISWVTASDPRVIYDSQQHTLSFGWQDACHRDLLGVGFAGEASLTCFATGSEVLPQFSHCQFAVVIFEGHQFTENSGVASQFQTAALSQAHTVHLPELLRRTSRAWAEKEDVVSRERAVLQGAEQSLAYTVYSFLCWLRHLNYPHMAREHIIDTLNAQGCQHQVFLHYVARADVLWALLTDTDLQRQWVASASKTLGERVCLAHDLVCALTPNQPDVCAWVVQLSAREQYNAISWLAQGIALNHLCQAKLQPDIPYTVTTDPVAVARKLSAVQPDTVRFAITVHEDVGHLTAALSTFTALSGLDSAYAQVCAAHEILRTEIDLLEGQLQTAFFQQIEGEAEIQARLQRALNDQTLSDAQTLKADIIALASAQDKSALAAMVNPLKTRAVLLSLKKSWVDAPGFRAEVTQVYIWCQDMMQQTRVDWVLPDPSAAITLSTTVCEAIEIELKALHNSATLIEQPLWTQARLQQQQLLSAQIRLACRQADMWVSSRIPESSSALAATRKKLIKMITHIRDSADWLASCRVWMIEIKAWAMFTKQQACQPLSLACVRIDAQLSSQAKYWPDIAEQIEATIQTAAQPHEMHHAE